MGRGRRVRPRWAVLLGLAGAVALACGDDVTAPPNQEPPEVEPPDTTTPPVPGPCEGTGTAHAGSTGGEVWDSTGNPHRVPETISVEGRLTIGPGVVVCLGAGAALRVSAEVLDVRGTEEHPVLLTTADSGVRWGGIETAASPDTIRLEHVRLEESEWGVRTEGTPVVLDHAHLRQVEGAAVRAPYAEIRHSLIDTACSVDCTAAVEFGLYGSHVFEESVIRGSGAVGLWIWYGTATDLIGGRIEGSAGVGLRVVTESARRRGSSYDGQGCICRGSLGRVKHATVSATSYWARMPITDSLAFIDDVAWLSVHHVRCEHLSLRRPDQQRQPRPH